MGDNALMSDVLELEDVSVVREGRALVDQVSWSVKEGSAGSSSARTGPEKRPS